MSNVADKLKIYPALIGGTTQPRRDHNQKFLADNQSFTMHLELVRDTLLIATMSYYRTLEQLKTKSTAHK